MLIYNKYFVELIKKFDNSGFFDDTVYEDMGRMWFGEIGTKIFYMILVSVINPSIFNFIKTLLVRCFRNIRASRAKTMAEYIELKKPLDFGLEKRFALLLNIFFISIILSSGIPLMILISSVTMFILFHVEKYIFIKYTKKPPIYTEAIMKLINWFLPLAPLLSIGLTIYILGNQDLFPTNGRYSSNQKYRVNSNQ
jgi:hypothetical protein